MTLNPAEAIARFDFARGEQDFPVPPAPLTAAQIAEQEDECWALLNDEFEDWDD